MALALTVPIVLSVLETADKFLHNSLIRKLLENWSHGTNNKIDDWIVDCLTDSDPTNIERKLEVVQIEYDKMTPEAKAEAKVAQPLPEEVVDVLLTRDA